MKDHGNWPTPVHGLLLKAALGDTEDALEAWITWRRRAISLDHIDVSTYRLLPIIWRNLSGKLSSDEDAKRLRGVYKRTWLKNHAFLHAMTSLAGDLERAGIPMLVVKGLPQAFSYYADAGQRVMNDMDLLVRPNDATAVAGIMARRGYCQSGVLPTQTWRQVMRTRHALAFINEGGEELDLHWYILHHDARHNVDDVFWTSSIPLEAGGVKFRAPSAALHLFLILAHGLNPCSSTKTQWVADAVTVLRMKPELDWEKFVSEAERRKLGVPIAHCLAYLRDSHGSGVPDRIINSLSSSNRGAGTSIRTWTMNRHCNSYLASLISHFIRFRRSESPKDSAGGGFIGYLCDAWGVQSIAKFPIALIYRLRRAVGRVTGHRAQERME